jgi:quercetin dioxygenase-like cupin family protein
VNVKTTTTQPYHVGNAYQDGPEHRGWLVGHFMEGPPQQADEVEIKWGIHPKGQQRPDWVRGETATTLCMVISGRFRLTLANGSEEQVLLSKQGDYALWGPGVDHLWTAEEDSVVLTVRWPSQPVR